MRHFLGSSPSFATSLLTGRVISAALPSLLMTSAGRPKRCLSARRRASRRAIPVPAVAVTAEKEHLAAPGTKANDEAK
jgi:hypothetical protein